MEASVASAAASLDASKHADITAGNEAAGHAADGGPGTSADPDNPLLKKVNELTAAVGTKPDDFSTWTSLLSAVEKLDDIDHIRSTYDAFFAEYPLCYGYWKKYAEAEKRHGSNEQATAVYERGCAATPYSTDLWVAYAAFLLATDADTDAIRSVYQRAVAYVGTDYSSHKLWDKFLEFEGNNGSPALVAALYSQVLSCPIKELDKYHTGLLDYAGSRTAHELLSEDAAAALRAVLEQQAADKQKVADDAEAAAKAAQAAADAFTAADAVTAVDAAADAAEKPAADDGSAAAADPAGAEMATAAVADGEPEAAPGEEPEDPEETAAAATAVDETADVKTEVKAEADIDMIDAEAAALADDGSKAETAAKAAEADTEMKDAEATAPADDSGTADAAATAAADGSVKTEAAAETAAVVDDSSKAEAAAKAAAEAETAAKVAADALAAAAAAAEAAHSDDAVKALWLQQQQVLYTATKASLEARKPFESAIRRPYWHIKALDGAQLRNWGAYLDWQEQQDDVAATVTLYERCLVPCAAYPEFWQRYVSWCESHHPDAAENALQRATAVHCKQQPGIWIFAARFYEARGDSDAAREQYKQLLTQVTPGLLEGVAAAANFERRVGDAAAAAAVFETALQQQQQQKEHEQPQEDDSKDEGIGKSSSTSSDAQGYLYLMYANFLRQVYNDIDKARSVLQQGLEAYPACKVLLDGAIYFEEALPGDDRVTRVLSLYDKALETNSSSSSVEALTGSAADGASGGESAAAAGAGAKQEVQQDADDQQQQRKGWADDVLEELSRRCVEFADMYADVGTVQRVQRRHSKLFGLPSAAAEAAAKATANGAAAADASRKRAAEKPAAAAAAANGHAAKSARTDAAGSSAAAAAVAQQDANAAAAAAAAAGYYPPAPSAYGGYGGYGMPPYGHPGYPPAYGHYGYGGY